VHPSRHGGEGAELQARETVLPGGRAAAGHHKARAVVGVRQGHVPHADGHHLLHLSAGPVPRRHRARLRHGAGRVPALRRPGPPGSGRRARGAAQRPRRPPRGGVRGRAPRRHRPHEAAPRRAAAAPGPRHRGGGAGAAHAVRVRLARRGLHRQPRRGGRPRHQRLPRRLGPRRARAPRRPVAAGPLPAAPRPAARRVRAPRRGVLQARAVVGPRPRPRRHYPAQHRGPQGSLHQGLRGGAPRQGVRRPWPSLQPVRDDPRPRLAHHDARARAGQQPAPDLHHPHLRGRPAAPRGGAGRLLREPGPLGVPARHGGEPPRPAAEARGAGDPRRRGAGGRGLRLPVVRRLRGLRHGGEGRAGDDGPCSRRKGLLPHGGHAVTGAVLHRRRQHRRHRRAGVRAQPGCVQAVLLLHGVASFKSFNLYTHFLKGLLLRTARLVVVCCGFINLLIPGFCKT
jgi:hypothetical protein